MYTYIYIYRGFLKWWYPTTIGFLTKNDHFGVFLGVPPFKETPIYLYIYIHIIFIMYWNMTLWTEQVIWEVSIFLWHLQGYSLCASILGKHLNEGEKSMWEASTAATIESCSEMTWFMRMVFGGWNFQILSIHSRYYGNMGLVWYLRIMGTSLLHYVFQSKKQNIQHTVNM